MRVELISFSPLSGHKQTQVLELVLVCMHARTSARDKLIHSHWHMTGCWSMRERDGILETEAHLKPCCACYTFTLSNPLAYNTIRPNLWFSTDYSEMPHPKQNPPLLQCNVFWRFARWRWNSYIPFKPTTFRGASRWMSLIQPLTHIQTLKAMWAVSS